MKMPIRQTHTFVELPVSCEAYEEIAVKLKAADYGHVFMPDGQIDMHGIALVREDERPALKGAKPVHSLSPSAKRIFRLMGSGKRLIIRRDGGGPPKLVDDPRFPSSVPDEDVELYDVSQLIEAGWISELTEHTTNNKIGWREAGLPGETHHVYACTQ
jgi:hypothetical protein